MTLLYFKDLTMSWQISWDFPEPLQFAAFVGRISDFTVDDKDSNKQGEKLWQQWFESVIQVLNSNQSSMAGEPMSALYSPPTFASTRLPDDLKQRCVTWWPVFQKEWLDIGGAKQQHANAIKLQRLNLNDLVNQVKRQKRSLLVSPFKLNILMTIWPGDYHRRLSNTVMVLGADYLLPKSAVQLKSILIDALHDLV